MFLPFCFYVGFVFLVCFSFVLVLFSFGSCLLSQTMKNTVILVILVFLVMLVTR